MIRTQPRKAPLVRIVSCTLSLAFLVSLLTGCSKLKDMMGKNEPQLTLEEERELLEVKKIAAERFEAKMAEQEPFDRRANLKRLLLENHQIDLDEIFPEGYDPDTLKTREEVLAIIKQRAEEAADKRFDERMLAETRRLAEIEYPLIEVGDEISVTTVRNIKYEGQVKSIDARVVKLGERELLIKDIKSPDPGCFHEESCQKLRDYYLRRHYKVPKEDFTRNRMKQIAPATMREFGFVLDGGDWLRMDTYIDRHVTDKLDQLAATYKANLEDQVRREVEAEMKAEGLLDIDVPVPTEDLVDRATGVPPPPPEE